MRVRPSLLSLVALASCATVPATHTPMAPAISVTAPVDGAAGVPVDAEITVSFSAPVTPLAINESTFTIMQGPQPIAGWVKCSGTTAAFVPSAPLDAGATFTATVQTRVADASSAQPGTYTWSFSTRGT